jgi:hypothetical protein
MRRCRGTTVLRRENNNGRHSDRTWWDGQLAIYERHEVFATVHSWKQHDSCPLPPGAGGVGAANHLANVVKRDGLTLGASSSALYTSAILGVTGVRYKLDDFVFLGAPYSGGPHTLVVRPDLHLDTVEKLRAYKGLRLPIDRSGTPSTSSTGYSPMCSS